MKLANSAMIIFVMSVATTEIPYSEKREEQLYAAVHKIVIKQ